MDDAMLTTIDNPYNPFTDFDEWYAFDEMQGYHTCSYLARVANTTEDMTEKEEDEAVKEAMDEIVRLNILGIYEIVTEADYESKPKAAV